MTERHPLESVSEPEMSCNLAAIPCPQVVTPRICGRPPAASGFAKELWRHYERGYRRSFCHPEYRDGHGRARSSQRRGGPPLPPGETCRGREKFQALLPEQWW